MSLLDLLRGRFLLIIIALVGLAVYWFSNQKPVGYFERRQVLTISLDDEMKLGRNAYNKILAEEAGNVICSGKDKNCQGDIVYRNAVVEVGADLRDAAKLHDAMLVQQGELTSSRADKFDWQFNVIHSDQPNAFCLPGGYVAIYTGIMDVTGNFDGSLTPEDVEDRDMLAVVMGHEIAHALLRHGGERMSQGRVFQIGQLAIGTAAGDHRAAQAFGLAAQTGVLLPFSRQHETEADELGLYLMARACYDPRGAPELWLRMNELSAGQKPPEFLSTHPSSIRRAENFKAWMPKALELYEASGCPPLSE